MYERRTVSKTDDMLKAVFGSPAVLAAGILLGILCAIAIYMTVTCYTFTDRLFDSEDFLYALAHSGAYDEDYSIGDMYIGMKGIATVLGFLFAGLAVSHAWATTGILIVYVRSKSDESAAPMRAGFTVLQIFAITKLILWVLPTMFWLLAALVAFSENIAVGMMMFVLAVLFAMRNISMVVAVSGVKRTIDDTRYAPSGIGALRFSACGMGIAAVAFGSLSLFSVLKNTTITEDVPKAFIDSMEALRIFLILIVICFFLYAAVHFLIFLIAGHYARKLPIAVNAQNVYRQNMANLYPDTYSNPPVQNTQSSFSPYKSPNDVPPNPDNSDWHHYSDGF